jgi:Cu-Zn family superoxide dismutase
VVGKGKIDLAPEIKVKVARVIHGKHLESDGLPSGSL